MGSLSPSDLALPAITKPLDVEEFRANAHRMVDFIADYYHELQNFRVRSAVAPGYLRPVLQEGPPAKGESLTSILDDVKQHIFPGITHWQSPNFFAYFPAGSSTAGLLGDMLSGAFNVIGFSWISSPAATELETVVLDWLADAMALPPGFHSVKSGGKGGGVIQGTASEAVLVAMLAAKNRQVATMVASGCTRSEATGKLVAYTSDQAHSCVQKACMVSGIEPHNFRALPTDASTAWALSPSVLAAAIEEDRKAGKVPFFLSATIGTTSSAAVDPLQELGAIAKDHSMWMHVDAAYAGSAALCPEMRDNFVGLDVLDSYCFNAHKWMLTNFDCSCLWVKESEWLVKALSLHPEYLRNKATESSEVVDYKDWQVPLGRRFRALKLWLVMRMNGIEGLRSFIRSHVAMAERLEGLIRADTRFEIVAPRKFSLVCFRLKPRANDTDYGKTLNAALLEHVNEDGKMFITHTIISGVYTLRMAIGATTVEWRHVEAAWNTILKHVEKV